MPLIVVGRGKTLQLRNVRVSNQASLAACLSLGPGARLLAEPSDGVTVLADDSQLRLGKQLNRRAMHV